MKKNKEGGNLTLPSETGLFEETKELIERWGADAIRDSDGTELSEEIKNLSTKIYSTYFVSRGHNEFVKDNLEQCQQIYLSSNFCAAKSKKLEIEIMDGYFAEQIKPDYDHDPFQWWEVIDRTTGEIVACENWEYNQETDTVTIIETTAFHEYSVSFLAYVIWDPTEMYNHLTNEWTDREHDIPFDVRKEKSKEFVLDYLKNWLKENEETDVVRFTTFFYHFTLVFNEEAQEKFVDWFGYSASVSPEAIKAFEKTKGYQLRPEDFIDQGYYNNPFRVPSSEFKDYMDFQQQFVAETAGELVEEVHQAGKEAMMFLGDNWIGTEPYGEYFSEINLDAVVGSVGGGATLRMISEIPGVKYTEARFLPYFFPDVFNEDNDPIQEAREVWLGARRAIMRKPVDRIGYGGYLSLAYKFPKFVNYIEEVSSQFRDIYAEIKDQVPYTGAKVAVLNSWGKIRSWQTHMVAHAIHYKQTYSYLGILEALSGMNVEVDFISFERIKESGVPADVDVIINAGDHKTAFSGDTEWLDSDLVTTIRKWVYNGGGLIGVGEPAAVEHQGRFFQLADILGVDKELGLSLNTDKYFKETEADHYIIEDQKEAYDFGEVVNDIYSISEETAILEYSQDEVHLAANEYGKGRGVYISGLPYNKQNTRLLLRSIFYAADKEKELYNFYADNINVEVHAYPEKKKYAVLNNTDQKQKTNIYLEGKIEKEIKLAAEEIVWFNY